MTEKTLSDRRNTQQTPRRHWVTLEEEKHKGEKEKVKEEKRG